MKISTKIILFCTLIALITIIVVVWWNNHVCVPPTIPLYPNRTLIKETKGDNISYIEQAFTSNDEPIMILEYYQTKATCYEISEGWTCTGAGLPRGQFTIYISNFVSAQTRFSTYINWDHCY